MNKSPLVLLYTCVLISIITPALGMHIMQSKSVSPNFGRYSVTTNVPTTSVQKTELELEFLSFESSDEFALLSPRKKLPNPNPASVVDFSQFQSRKTNYCKQGAVMQCAASTDSKYCEQKLIAQRDFIAESIKMGNLRNIAGLVKAACELTQVSSIVAEPRLIVILNLPKVLLDAVLDNQLDAVKAICAACEIQEAPAWLEA